MAALVIGTTESERIRTLASMLAAKLPDDYELLLFAEGFYVYKDMDKTLTKSMDDREFRRLANFAQNHNLRGSVCLFGGLPCVSLCVK